MAETAAQKRQRKIDELEGFQQPPLSDARRASRDAFVAAANAESNAQNGPPGSRGFGVARDPNDPAVANSVGQRPVVVDGQISPNARFPSNDVAGLTTPPPQSPAEQADRFQQRAGADIDLLNADSAIGSPPAIESPPTVADLRSRVPGGEFVGRVGDAFRRPVAEGARGVGERARAVAGSLLGPPIEGIGELVKEDLDTFSQDISDIGNFAGGFFSTAQAGEPTGTRDVDTQGQVPTGDLQASIEDGPGPGRSVARPRLGDVSGVLPVVPGTERITEADLGSFGVTPEEAARNANAPVGDPTNFQVQDNADPGQQSIAAPPQQQSVEVIRGTSITDDFFAGPDKGLNIPRGFDRATGRRIAALTRQGASIPQAIDAMSAMDDAAARLINAGANRRNSFANSTTRFNSNRGIVLQQIDDEGNVGFIDTGFNQILEPKVGNLITKNAIGEQTSVPSLMYPVHNFDTGEPVIDPITGLQDIASIPFAEIGIDPNNEEAKQEAITEWQQLLSEGFTTDEIIEAMQE